MCWLRSDAALVLKLASQILLTLKLASAVRSVVVLLIVAARYSAAAERLRSESTADANQDRGLVDRFPAATATANCSSAALRSRRSSWHLTQMFFPLAARFVSIRRLE